MRSTALPQRRDKKARQGAAGAGPDMGAAGAGTANDSNAGADDVVDGDYREV